VVFTWGLVVSDMFVVGVEFCCVMCTKLFVVLVFVWLEVPFVMFVVAKAVPALKGSAMANSNSTVIIDFLLIIPPPCPKGSKKVCFEPLRT